MAAAAVAVAAAPARRKRGRGKRIKAPDEVEEGEEVMRQARRVLGLHEWGGGTAPPAGDEEVEGGVADHTPEYTVVDGFLFTSWPSRAAAHEHTVYGITTIL